MEAPASGPSGRVPEVPVHHRPAISSTSTQWNSRVGRSHTRTLTGPPAAAVPGPEPAAEADEAEGRVMVVVLRSAAVVTAADILLPESPGGTG
ncbi:hypothetical protein GCM10009099_32860 [Caenispirillum bisanense]